MTEEQKATANRPCSEAEKDRLISKMLECPGKLSDSEIMQILADDELRDIYSISVEIKAAKRNQAEIDASQEWQRFAPRLAKSRRLIFGRLTHVAAILAGAILATAAVLFVTNGNTATQKPLVAHNGGKGLTTPLDTPTDTAADTTIVTQLDAPNSEAEHPASKPVKACKPVLAHVKSDKVESEKANHTQASISPQGLDVEEYMRVQQARIDNDLAMQRAEALMAQYYAMVEADGGPFPALAIDAIAADGYSIDDEIVTLIIP